MPHLLGQSDNSTFISARVALRDMIKRVQHGTAQRDPKPLWHVLGWRREGNRHFGSYRTQRKQWAGEIEEPIPGSYRAYLENAPVSVLNGPHRSCFRQDFARSKPGKTVHFVHLSPEPRSPEEAINAVERILSGKS